MKKSELVVEIRAWSPEDVLRPDVREASGLELNEHGLPTTRSWHALKDDEREAVLYLVRDGLLELLDLLPQWVPGSFIARNDHRLDVTFAIAPENLDHGVMQIQRRSDRAVDKAVFGLRDIASE